MTRKRLSTRSQVSTTAVKPGALGGISGKNRGLFTLDHFCRRQDTNTNALQSFSHFYSFISMKGLLQCETLSFGFSKSIHCNSASLDSGVNCSDVQIMHFIVEQDLQTNVSQGLTPAARRVLKASTKKPTGQFDYCLKSTPLASTMQRYVGYKQGEKLGAVKQWILPGSKKWMFISNMELCFSVISPFVQLRSSNTVKLRKPQDNFLLFCVCVNT